MIPPSARTLRRQSWPFIASAGYQIATTAARSSATCAAEISVVPPVRAHPVMRPAPLWFVLTKAVAHVEEDGCFQLAPDVPVWMSLERRDQARVDDVQFLRIVRLFPQGPLVP